MFSHGLSQVKIAGQAAVENQDQATFKMVSDFMAKFGHPKEVSKQEFAYCKLMDTHEDGTRRIMIGSGTTAEGVKAFEAVIQCLKATGAKEQEGVAPRGGLIRKVQDLLETGKGIVKKR